MPSVAERLSIRLLACHLSSLESSGTPVTFSDSSSSSFLPIPRECPRANIFFICFSVALSLESGSAPISFFEGSETFCPGVSTAKIGKEISLPKEKVKSILDNPIYTGYITPRRDKYGHRVQDIRKWIKGNQESIIPIDFYLEVQKVWRKGQRTTKHIGLFQKIVYCQHCEHNLTFAVKNRNGKKIFSHNCAETNPGSKHCGRYIREEILESIALDSVEKLFNISIPKPETKNIASEISKIDRKIERVVAMLDDENVPVGQIKVKLAELQEIKSRLFKNQKPREDIQKHFKNLKELYPYMAREERKRLWSITIEKIALYKTLAVVEWKDGRQTKHSLANVLMCGGDEGI